MKILNCENKYISCASNCYPHCLDTIKNFIIFGSSNSIAFYDLNSKHLKSTFSFHSNLVNSVRWIDDDGKYFISSSVDKTCIIWQKSDDNLTFNVKHVLGNHQDSVIISDSKPIKNQNDSLDFYSVSSSNDECLRIWLNDQVIYEETLKHFIFDVRIYDQLIIPGLIIITAGSNDIVQVNRFDVESKKLELLITLKGHSDWIKSVDIISTNGKLMLASASQDFLVRVYEIKETSAIDANIINEVFTVDSKKFSCTLDTVLAAHEGWVTDVKWIHFENRIHLLTCSMDKMIILWEQMDDKNDSIWNEKFRFGEVGGQAFGFLCCSFVPSMELIIGQSFNGAIHIWKRTKEQDYWVASPPITGHFREVTDLVWEPEGDYYLTCSSDQTTRLHSSWNVDNMISWHEIARPQIHGYDIKSLSMAGRLKFVSGADEKVIRIFNATKSFVESIQKISGVQVDINGQEIAECAIVPSLGLSNSAVYDTSEIEKEFKPKTLEIPPSEEVLLQNTLWSESQKLYGHGYEIFAVAVNHSNTLLASACKASNANHAAIILWDLKTFKRISDLYSHNLTVTQMRFSPDDSYLLSVSRDRTWALFEMKTSEYRRIAFSDKQSGIHSRIIWDCAWTLDSKYFLTGSRDKSVITWFMNDESGDSNSTFQIQQKDTIAFDHPVTSLDVHEKFYSDNSYLVCFGFENGSLLLYSLSIDSSVNWSKLYDFHDTCHTSMVNRIRFSPKINQKDSHDIVYLASCSQDRSTKLFEITF